MGATDMDQTLFSYLYMNQSLSLRELRRIHKFLLTTTLEHFSEIGIPACANDVGGEPYLEFMCEDV